MSIHSPKLILLFSGKRKSGKDTITDIIFERVKDVATIIKISAPIKTYFSKNRGLDLNQLMGNGSYKEQFRLEMIQWSEKVRKSDYGYFCRAALQSSDIQKPVWIVSDIRRRTDIQWFKENYTNIQTIRVYSTEEERMKRGWIFTAGIDDQETECDLDFTENWDIVIENNSSIENQRPTIDSIGHIIRQAVEAS